MNIYKSVVAPEEYEWVVAVHDGDFQRLRIESPERLLDAWSPVEVELVREDEGVKMMEADFPWLGEHALVMRPSAATIVAPLVRECAELLRFPLATRT